MNTKKKTIKKLISVSLSVNRGTYFFISGQNLSTVYGSIIDILIEDSSYLTICA